MEEKSKMAHLSLCLNCQLCSGAGIDEVGYTFFDCNEHGSISLKENDVISECLEYVEDWE